MCLTGVSCCPPPRVYIDGKKIQKGWLACLCVCGFHIAVKFYVWSIPQDSMATC